MEKNGGSRSNAQPREEFQKQNPEIYQEGKVDAKDLQSNRQESKKESQNNTEQDFPQANEEKKDPSAEGLKQEINVKEKVEILAENPLVQERNLIQRIKFEALVAQEESDELAESMFVQEKDAMKKQRNESPEEILIAPIKDLLPAAKQISNNTAQQKWDRIAKNKRLEANETLQQRNEVPGKLSILSSKQSLQQPYEAMKIREERSTVTQKESASASKVSERLEGVETTRYDARENNATEPDRKIMQRKQELRTILADFFSKQNQVILQQRRKRPAQNLFAPVPVLKPVARHDSNDLVQHELHSIAKNGDLDASTTLQQSELPGKLSILSSKKENLQQPCKVSEENIKVREDDVVTQQENGTPDRFLQTPLASGATQSHDHITKQREQELSKILTEYLSKQQQVNQQETEIRHQKNIHNLDNSKGAEPQRPKETVTYRKPQGNWNGFPRELGDNLIMCPTEFDDNILTRSREEEEDGCHTEIKVKKVEYGASFPVRVYGVKRVRSQPSKDYVTFHKRDLENTTACPKKIKDYVTFHHRKSTVTALSPQRKEYVTLRPRRTDNEILQTKTSSSFSSSTSKGYVTTQPIIQKENPPPAPEPPTHIFWPVRRFPANILDPEQLHVPPRSIQKPASTPDSEDPPYVSIRAQLLEEASPFPLSSRTRPRQSLLPLMQRLHPVPEDDFPLVPFEEVCPETIIETNGQGILRNKILGALIPPLSAGVQDFVQRFCGCHIEPERQSFFKKLITKCMMIFFSIFTAGVVVSILYLTMFLAGIWGSNVTSDLNDSQLNLSIPVIDVKFHRQNEQLDGKAPKIHLVDSNVNFTTPEADFYFNIPNSLANLGGEIIPVINGLKDNVINYESNMATVVTIKLINLDFNVTTPVNDFHFITPVTDMNAINAVTDFDLTIPIPVTDFNINLTTCT